MMITGITTYTPIRQAQKVNFNGIFVEEGWVKEHIGLSDDEIDELNRRCPQDIDINVEDFGTDGHHTEVCRARVSRNWKDIDYEDFDVYYNMKDEYKAKQASKNNFMNKINIIFRRYSEKGQ